MVYIEDDDNNISLVKALLLKRRPQIGLRVATNGRDGVQAAIDEPALILLDNRLPDATGSEILRKLASLPATAGIPR